jgi:hypothetical protein
MTDDDLNCEIAAALDVDPSPTFIARVRQRVAQDATPVVWSWSWSIGAVTALVTAVMAAVIFQIQRDTPQTVTPIESRPVTGVAELQTDRRSGRLSAPAMSGFNRSPAMARAPQTTSPEILIDVREANALRALLSAASRGQIDLTPLAAAMATSSEPQPPSAIVIAPLIIPPLAPEPGEGARQ